MRILVSNDDGIFSPGIRALAKVAAEFGHVRVVAPDVEQSAMSHAITIRRPLHYIKTELNGIEGYRVDGTPADCVALGSHLWEKVDLVLTGINLGLNIGHNIWHSGTVAAAKQAAFLNIPAIAYSAPYDGKDLDYRIFEDHIRETIKIIMDFEKPHLLNVNFPNHESKGLRWTKQSIRHYEGIVVASEDPFGREHYWFSERPRDRVEVDTDRWAVGEGYTSITPLRLNLTDEDLLGRVIK